ncbi:nicotinate-nucleotide adenylyltransferase [Cystoisospora suis]|uniref:Nicotinate-nucleotide adenylyltransferase n=1 Tax=Cystoisospora suis TaxID=483139 RepID=A0A2C6LCE4_9APIC|nr:nicotinate-nucleotide adenylyltransferase [Cystoisospora suis]
MIRFFARPFSTKCNAISSLGAMKRRICYFGGSFDPPTYGHMFSAASVLASGSVDELWFSPCGGDPPSSSSSSCLSQKSEFEKQEASGSSSSCHGQPSHESLPPGDSSSHLHIKEARPLTNDTEEKHESSNPSLNGERERDTLALSSSLSSSCSPPPTNKKIRLTEKEGNIPKEDVHGDAKSRPSLNEGNKLESDAIKKKQKEDTMEATNLSSSSSKGLCLQRNGTYKVRPDKTLSTPARLRLEMLKLAVSHFFGEAVEVIDDKEEREEKKKKTRDDGDCKRKHDGSALHWEKPKIHIIAWEACTPGYTPTYKVLQRLEEENPDAEFSLLVGEDILPDLHKWCYASLLIEKYRFLVLPRSAAAHHIPQLLTNLHIHLDHHPKPLLNGATTSSPLAKECVKNASIDISSSSSSSPSKKEEEREISTTMTATPLNVEKEKISKLAKIAEETEKELSRKIQEAIKTVKRLEYIDELCMHKGRAYFPWPASSSYVRRVLKQRTSDPSSMAACTALVSPSVLAFIQRQGLYTVPS